MAQSKTEKVLGLISEADILAERRATAKLIWFLNNMPAGFTKAKLASIMGITLADLINLYDDYLQEFEQGESQ